MASGQIVVQVLDVMPPGPTLAALTRRAGGSTPAEGVQVWAFDASTIEYLDFKCYLLPNYAGGGTTFTLPWSAASATSNATRWGIAVRRVADDADGNKKLYSVAGTKGYQWLEADVVRGLDRMEDVDLSYFDKLVESAVDNIGRFGDFAEFVK